METLKILNTAEHQQKSKSIDQHFPKDLKNNEIKNELNEIKKLEEEMISNMKLINTYMI